MSRITPMLLLSLLAGCAVTPEPYNGIKGYQLQNSDKGLTVIYTDYAEKGKNHITAMIASVCAYETGRDVLSGSLSVTNDRTDEKRVEVTVRVPTTTYSAQNNVMGEGKVITSHHEQSVFDDIKFREITAMCPPAGT